MPIIIWYETNNNIIVSTHIYDYSRKVDKLLQVNNLNTLLNYCVNGVALKILLYLRSKIRCIYKIILYYIRLFIIISKNNIQLCNLFNIYSRYMINNYRMWNDFILNCICRHRHLCFYYKIPWVNFVIQLVLRDRNLLDNILFVS